MHKEDLALNNLKGLIFQKPNLTELYIFNIYKRDSALNNQRGLICQLYLNETM